MISHLCPVYLAVSPLSFAGSSPGRRGWCHISQPAMALSLTEASWRGQTAGGSGDAASAAFAASFGSPAPSFELAAAAAVVVDAAAAAAAVAVPVLSAFLAPAVPGSGAVVAVASAAAPLEMADVPRDQR